MGEQEKLEKYLKEIEQYRELTGEEEEVLCRRILKSNDNIAKQKLAQANLRFVVEIAEEYEDKNPDVGILDLVQEGNLGLFKAVENWNYNELSGFREYATFWIRKAIDRRLGIEEND